MDQILQRDDEAAHREMIVFHGDNGIGKTRILDAVTLCAMEKNIR